MWLKANTEASSSTELFESYDGPDAETRTDKLGTFRFEDIPPGHWYVGVAPVEGAAKFPALAEAVELKATEKLVELALKLDAGLFLRGRVIDASGAPVGACDLSAEHLELGTYVFAESQADGTFQLGPLPPGLWELGAGSFSPRGAPSLTVQAEAGAGEVVLQLRAAGAIAGRIVGSSGELIAEAEVTLSSQDPSGWFQTGGAQAGEFRLQGVLPGGYCVWARDSSGAIGSSGTIDVVAGETLRNVEIRLARGAQLALRYTGQDTSARFWLLAGKSRFHFDSFGQGRWATATVPAGPVEIQLEVSDGSTIKTQSITLSADERQEIVWDGKP
ncbi:MAG TPA: carboxypeptidase-like regulatory domain-containing protein [Planctomycetota bacterium]|nr:carboxypeptidase-like regulatory domain-containing protein [Planctomycetota bacterium]